MKNSLQVEVISGRGGNVEVDVETTGHPGNGKRPASGSVGETFIPANLPTCTGHLLDFAQALHYSTCSIQLELLHTPPPLLLELASSAQITASLISMTPTARSHRFILPRRIHSGLLPSVASTSPRRQDPAPYPTNLPPHQPLQGSPI